MNACAMPGQLWEGKKAPHRAPGCHPVPGGDLLPWGDSQQRAPRSPQDPSRCRAGAMLAPPACLGAVLQLSRVISSIASFFFGTGAGLFCSGDTRMPVSHAVGDDCPAPVLPWALSAKLLSSIHFSKRKG